MIPYLSTPTVLLNVQRSLIRSFDVSIVLWDALAEFIPPVAFGPVLALDLIVSYLNAAKRQQRRIELAKPIAFDKPHSKRRLNSNLFNDIHFYLICWSRISKFGRFISNKTRFKRVGLVLRHHAVELKKRVDCRDHLEHFEERLPGGINQNKLSVRKDLLNLENNYVTYGGSKVEIGKDSFRLLSNIVAELRTAILFDAIDLLNSCDADYLSNLIQKSKSDIQIVKLSKAIQNKAKVKK